MRWWGEVICHKKVQSFLNQSLDPPNKKFLDPPLLLGHFQRKGSVKTREDCANSGIRAYDKNDENMKLKEIEHHRSWKMEKSLKVG